MLRLLGGNAVGLVVSREVGAGVVSFWQNGATPVKGDMMAPYLARYPDRKAAVLLANGFCLGFWILSSAVGDGKKGRNLASAYAYGQVVTDKIKREVFLGRMLGPFHGLPLADLKGFSSGPGAQ